jgi:hypothetical protein
MDGFRWAMAAGVAVVIVSALVAVAVVRAALTVADAQLRALGL